MAESDEIFRGVEPAFVVVRRDVGERRRFEIAVDEHHRRAVAVDRFQRVGFLPARHDDDAVDHARYERFDTGPFEVGGAHRVDQHGRVAEPARFADDGAGDVGEVGVVDPRHEQSDRVGFLRAQTFGQQTRLVISTVGLFGDELDGFLADPVLVGFAVEHAGDRRNGKSGSSGQRYQSLFSHR